MNEILDQIAKAYDAEGISAALATAETRLRSEKRYHELFEVLKMKSRQQQGLALLHEDGADVSDEQQRVLEDNLLESCREVGFALLQDGQIQESWMYLRHLNDRQAIRDALSKAEVNEENLEQHVALLLYEGLDCEAGYGLVLEHYGTCNAITTMQQALYGRPRPDRQAAGRLLVAHVHQELLENVKGHIEREENESPKDKRLVDLMQDRDYLFADGSYHIDTSHLSSTVQVAGELDDRKSLELAYDMTKYGERLDKGLQYSGEPPFEDVYPTYGKFFAALLGERCRSWNQALRITSENVRRPPGRNAHDRSLHRSSGPRLGKPAEAIEATVDLIPQGIQTAGRAPTLYDLSEQLGNFERYRELCAERNDMLGYVVSLGK